MPDRSVGEQFVIDYLTDAFRSCGCRRWVSPTEIGLAADDAGVAKTKYGSPWASPICKRLVEEGVLVRNTRGQYMLAEVPDA